MLKEAFQHLIEVGQASAPTIVETRQEPPDYYYLRQKDGSLVKVQANQLPATHAAYSLQPLIDFAKEFTPNARLWYSPTQIVCTFGDRYRNRMALDLAPSEPMAMLRYWKERKPSVTQAELIRELRTTFRDALSLAGNVVEILRRVNFKATAETAGEIGHGRASLGKTIAGEVTGAGQIPEYVKFVFPVFLNPCLKSIQTNVECALEPDAGTGTFRVIPLPGQLEGAMDFALREIAKLLAEAMDGNEVGIHYGKP